MTPVVETHGLGKRYRRSGLAGLHRVGPRGQVGVGRPTGRKTCMGGCGGGRATGPGRFVAQDKPAYASLSVARHLQMGAGLNPGWDGGLAAKRIERLGLDARQPAGSLSGGQRAQLALTLAIAKRPQLLLLDEPVANLDPLARREFLGDLMEVVATEDVSVVLSSHLVADLERVCDYLVVLAASRVQLAGELADLLGSHFRLTGPRRDPGSLPAGQTVIEESHTDKQSTLLIRSEEPILDPAWTVRPVTMEDLVLAYMGRAPEDSTQRSAGLEVLR